MSYDCWRGMVGMIKPTKGSGSLVELIKMLPDGIGVIPLFNNVRHGRIEEFQAAIPAYEEKIAELAEDKVDLIHPAGTPPFMLLGYKGEARDHRQMGKAIRHSDLHFGHESSGRDEGAQDQEVRRHRLRLRRHEHCRAILYRCWLRCLGIGETTRTVGRGRPAIIERYLLSGEESVS